MSQAPAIRRSSVRNHRQSNQRRGANEVINLNFDRSESYERGAAVLLALACPGELDSDLGSQRYLSLCGKALWLQSLATPDDWTPITVKPQYVFRDVKIIDRDVAFIAKRLGERMVAARMAIPYFQQAELGRLPPLPNGLKRLSVNQMAEFVSPDAGMKDPENIKKRIWKASRPVIHLAAAAALIGQELKRRGLRLCLELFLFCSEFIEAIVQRAEALRQLAARDPKFPVGQKELIPVHLVRT